MRKTANNIKMIRIAALALASVLAFTALPMRTFAEEIPGAPQETQENAQGQSENQGTTQGTSENQGSTRGTAENQGTPQVTPEPEPEPTPSTPQEPEKVLNAVEANAGMTELLGPAQSNGQDTLSTASAKASISAAEDAIKKSGDNNVLAKEALQDLEGAKGDLKQVEADLKTIKSTAAEGDTKKKTAQKHIADAAAAETEAKNLVNEGMDALTKADEQGKTFADNVQDVKENRNAVFTDVDIANGSSSQTVAYAAAGRAANDLQNAEDALTIATKKHNEAEKKKEDAEKKRDLAAKELAAAEAELENALGDAKKAEQKVNEAKEKLAYMQEAVDESRKTADELRKIKEIQEQYYAMTVQYYRTMGCAAFNEDGTLDLANSVLNAQKTMEDGTPIVEYWAKNQKEQIFVMGRYLTKQLVEYMLLYGDAKDADKNDLQFTFGEDAAPNKQMQKGVVYKDNKGEDTALTGTGIKTDSQTKDKVYPGEVVNIKWNQPPKNSKDYSNVDGRSNYVVVTYKKKDGNIAEIRYNYVFKTPKYDGEVDLTKGMIYLATISEDGKEVTRDDDPKNLDDYSELFDEELVKIVNYKAAMDALNETSNKITAIKKEIERLKNAKTDAGAEIGKLEKELQETEADMENIQVWVEEAREKYATIDLSRFNNSNSDDDNSGGNDDDVTGDDGTTEPGGTPAGGQPTTTTPGGAQPQVLGANRPNGGQGTNNATAANNKKAGVLGANRDVAEIAAATDDEKLEADLQKKIEEVKNNSVDKELVTIAEDEVAKAKTFDTEETHPNWWWLLLFLIVLVGLILKKKYDDHRRKVKAGSQTTVNQSNRK